MTWLWRQLARALFGGLAKWLAGLWQRRQLVRESARADRAEDLARQQAQTLRHAAARAQAAHEVANLPDAPATPVADADRDTAAGKLRDGGWTRD